jgi:hypothetical protein
MVQILEEGRPSFVQSLLGGLAEGIPGALQQYQQQKKQIADMQRENKAARRLGIDLSGMQNPEMRKAAMTELLKQQGKQNILGQKQQFLNEILNKGSNKTTDGISSTNKPENLQANNDQEDRILNLSDEDIIAAEAMGIPGLREAKNAKNKKIEDEKKETRRAFESDREYHTKISAPFIKEASEIIKNDPIAQGLIDQQRRDIGSGNTSGLIPFLTDKLGLEAYRNPESARFKTASKERFIEGLHSLGGAGARPNQFIEQQLVGAQAALGRSEEANQSVLDVEQFIKDLKTQRAKYTLEEAEKDQEKYGYERSDISRRVDKLMEAYAEQRQDEMAYDIRKRHEANMSNEQIIEEILSKKVPPDTPLTLRTARILMIKNNDDEKKAQSEAKKLGFRFPSEKTYMRG